MAVDAAVSPQHLHARPRVLARAYAVPTWLLLGGIVVASAAVRFAAALPRKTIALVPDEYIYWTLARSLAESGRPLIRGELASFPALLEPLAAAPLHLFTSLDTAFRLTQALHSLAMSAAAIPVYLLARRLGLGRSFALAAGALAVAVPGLVYTSYVLSEPIAYPLALAAIYLGVRALDEPTWRSQLAFLGVAGLTTFARVQYVVLPLVFVAAALVVERFRVRTALARFRVTAAALAVPPLAALALGPTRVLGYYHAILDLGVRPDALAESLGTHLLVLAYSAGLVFVPAALLAVGAALVRPRERVEAAFGAFAVGLALFLLAQATLYATNGLRDGGLRFKERYLLALIPLVPLAFGLYLKRGAPWRLGVAGVAAGLLVLSVRVPLSQYAVADNWQDSPFLFSVVRLQRVLSVADTSLVIAALAALLLVLAVVVALRARGAVALAFAASFAVAGALSVGAHQTDHAIVATHVRSFLPADDFSWLDGRGAKDVQILVTPGDNRALAIQQMAWNRSITRVLQMAGTAQVDAFRQSAVRIGRDGSILDGGRPVRRPLVVEQHGSTVVLRNATREYSSLAFDFWRPRGTPKLALIAKGRWFDSFTDRGGHISVWGDDARVAGTLTLRISLPEEPSAELETVVRFFGRGAERRVTLRDGDARTLTFGVPPTSGPWTLRWYADRAVQLGDGRRSGMEMEVPTFRPAPASARS